MTKKLQYTFKLDLIKKASLGYFKNHGDLSWRTLET